MSKDVLVVSKADLSMVESNALSLQQLSFLVKRTPEKYIRKRPAKGGGEWTYVTAGYVKKCLNLMFGWDWDFEVVENIILHGEAIVKGRLTVRTNGKTIIKTQFGNKDIVCRKGTEIPLSIGNDLKSAASDALKKCASELGIAADVYNAAEFREVFVMDDISKDDLVELYEIKKDGLSIEDIANAERIIGGNEVASYAKLFKLLQSC